MANGVPHSLLAIPYSPFAFLNSFDALSSTNSDPSATPKYAPWLCIRPLYTALRTNAKVIRFSRLRNTAAFSMRSTNCAMVS